MRNTLLMSAALLGLSTAAYAQSTNAQSPPSPTASSQTVQPTNSLPPGGGNTSGFRAGDRIGATATAPRAGMGVMPQAGVGTAAPMGAATMGQGSTMGDEAAPMPEGRRGRAAMREHGMRHHGQMARGRMHRGEDMDDTANAGGRAPADQYNGVPPTSAYQGGAGSPRSNVASNIDRGDTRSEIAPRLPDPGASGSTAQDYLAAAQRALSRNQTGAAQEALERAQTRILTRSTDPSMANMPDDSGAAQAITEARRALANRDSARARSILSQYMNRG